jgi:hypothetical protein
MPVLTGPWSSGESTLNCLVKPEIRISESDVIRTMLGASTAGFILLAALQMSDKVRQISTVRSIFRMKNMVGRLKCGLVKVLPSLLLFKMEK